MTLSTDKNDIIIELLKDRSSTKSESLLSPKTLSSLVIAAIIGGVAFLFSSVVDQPKTTASIQVQNTEIKGLLTDMKSNLSAMGVKIDGVMRDTSEVRSTSARNTAQIEALEDRVNKLEGHKE